MCRVVAYLGEPVVLDDLLFSPDNSLIRQTYAPQHLRLLNLAGFGLAAWDPTSRNPEEPFTYHTPDVPIFDSNLKALSRKVRAGAVLAHVRGVAYTHGSPVGPSFVHPFLYPGMRVALAHNGDLAGFREMRPRLERELRPEISKLITTNLDSEWIYALFLSQLEDPGADHTGAELADALVATIEILGRVRESCGIGLPSGVNLFVANRHAIVAVRYVFDFGARYREGHILAMHDPYEYLSLWYSVGRQYGCHEGEWKMIGGRKNAQAVLLASEPLTRDETTWLEVPDYSLVSFDIGSREPRIESRFLCV